jgi:hypothetical protein
LSGCKPGGVHSVAYSPETGEWQQFADVASPKGFEATTGSAITSTGLGWTGSEAVFAVSNANGGQDLILLNPSTGRSRLTDYLSRADAVCVSGGRIVGVRTGEIDAQGGYSSPNPSAVAEPLRTYELRTGDMTWNEISSVSKPASNGAVFERVYCSQGELVYLPIMPAPEGYGSGGMWWNPKLPGWDALPSFGPAGFPGDARIARVNGNRVIWLLGGRMYVLPPSAGQWRNLPAPSMPAVGLGSVSGLLLVKIGQQPGPAVTSVGLVDLTRYIEVASQ